MEDYALLGDCETAALVSRGGSIDWLCWPRFDGGACFAALLGGPEHGRWLLAPANSAARSRRRYRADTLILETDFETPEGAVSVIDFMPMSDGGSSIVRLVVGRRGQMAMRTELVLRFDFGFRMPWVTRMKDGTTCAVAGPHRVAMRTPVALRGEDFRTVGDFTVAAGQTVPFVLAYSPSHLPLPGAIDAAAALSATERYWRQWVAEGSDAGEYSEIVRRSLITLKALTYYPTGGIVAAPTTSLPERIGGQRNWDYRFCWLRDATFTLQAMMNAGYYQEAQAWRSWLIRAVAGDPAQVQIMYGLGGERRLTEWEVPWLPGYENSRPVRIGNAASEQRQLDMYGEIMDALHHGRVGKLAATEDDWSLQHKLLEHLETIWDQPDCGMWEVRGDPQHFTYSKAMAWVAFDRAIKTVEQFGLQGPLDHWKSLRARIHEEICRHGFNPKIGAFVQSYGSSELDASVLLLPLVGFLPPADARVRSTIEAIERHLMADGFIRRYRTSAGGDGLPPGEGAFLACSFWFADNLVLLGRQADARALFERLLGLCNDVGLLAEEYDPLDKRLIGNFPQAFSHIAIVNTAHNLTRAAGPARQRAS
ncbi:MAG TPA: glycoside hydrolase family 15 protein [Steroidobacteraceae bacterium]